MRVALIDADILAYQAAVTAEKPVDWGDGLWTLHAFETECIAAFESIYQKIMEKTGAGHAIMAFSDSNNWRKEVLPTYKSNRSGIRRPLLLKFLREWAMDEFEYHLEPTLEGDDVLGLLATNPDRWKAFDQVVCSIDKDFKTIPGKHYNFGKDEFYEVSQHQADIAHMMQTLTGDSTDGYTGCPGCGPKTAEKILKAAIEEGTPWADPQQLRIIMWEHVIKAYEKAGFGDEEALTQARVARILRHGEYDFYTHKVKLWTPN